MHTPSVISQILDEEIRLLTDLKGMASNPRLLDIMRRIVEAAGNNDSVVVHVHNERLSQPESSVPARPRRSAARVRQHNGLAAATLNAIQAKTEPFTILEIVEDLKHAGFNFVAAKPRIAVAQAFKSIIKRDLVQRVEKGVGNKPHVYRFRGGQRPE